MAMLYGQHGRHDGGADARRQFQCAGGLGPITNHAREVGYHVLHRMGYLVVVAAHEVGDAATAARTGHDASAEGRQGAQRLLDVDGREMRECEGADEFFLRVVVLTGEDHDGHRGTDALVATAAVAHDGYLGTGHAGIAGTTGLAEHFGKDAVAHDAAPQGTAHGLAQLMAVVLAQSVGSGGLVEPFGFEYETKVVEGRRCGKFINLRQR